MIEIRIHGRGGQGGVLRRTSGGRHRQGKYPRLSELRAGAARAPVVASARGRQAHPRGAGVQPQYRARPGPHLLDIVNVSDGLKTAAGGGELAREGADSSQAGACMARWTPDRGLEELVVAIPTPPCSGPAQGLGNPALSARREVIDDRSPQARTEEPTRPSNGLQRDGGLSRPVSHGHAGNRGAIPGPRGGRGSAPCLHRSKAGFGDSRPGGASPTVRDKGALRVGHGTFGRGAQHHLLSEDTNYLSPGSSHGRAGLVSMSDPWPRPCPARSCADRGGGGASPLRAAVR
jgi:hypothetical protein